MRGLLIREPWIGMILAGQKHWEMRSKSTQVRGPIALIRAGSGLVVGTAVLSDCLPALDADEMRDSSAFHGLPADRLDEVMQQGWTTPWVLSEVRVLQRPVPYRHRSGAVVWIDLEGLLEGDLDSAASTPTGDCEPLPEAAPARPMPIALPQATPTASAARPSAAVVPVQLSTAPGRVLTSIDIPLTQGNLNNHHIYLRRAMDMVPRECVGGSNAGQAGQTIEVVFSPGPVVHTDVDGDKMALRNRKAVRAFFEQSGCRAGDAVRFSRLGERLYRVERVPANGGQA